MLWWFLNSDEFLVEISRGWWIEIRVAARQFFRSGCMLYFVFLFLFIYLFLFFFFVCDVDSSRFVGI